MHSRRDVARTLRLRLRRRQAEYAGRRAGGPAERALWESHLRAAGIPAVANGLLFLRRPAARPSSDAAAAAAAAAAGGRGELGGGAACEMVAVTSAEGVWTMAGAAAAAAAAREALRALEALDAAAGGDGAAAGG